MFKWITKVVYPESFTERVILEIVAATTFVVIIVI